jgi:hypothetical protein
VKINLRECATIFLYVVLASACLSVLAMVWWPYKPLQIDSFTVDKTVVTRGDSICYTIKGEKFYDMPVDVTIELIDGESVAIMSYTANMPKGKLCRTRCFLVPYHVKPGLYRVNWTGVYTMNALNHVRVRMQSEFVRVK